MIKLEKIEENCLWAPSENQIKNANLTAYMEFLKKKFNLNVNSFDELYEWSVNQADVFWESIWIFCKVKSHTKYISVVENALSFEKAQWFSGALLNYTENLLRKNNSENALVFWGEDKIKRKMSWQELNNQVSILQQHYKKIGLKKGDRVALFVPNIPETIVCVLAAASLGAISSLCSPDFGVQAVVDRFGQIEPAFFIYADQYIYNGKNIDVLEKSKEIVKNIPSIKNSLCISYLQENKLGNYHNILTEYTPQEMEYEYFPFDHPLYILFSSGTTGIPKCLVHGVGGTLIQHLKEHSLHCNIKEGTPVFYFTTCGWMMWHWLVGALGCGATLLLYDGSPFSPNHEILFQYLSQEKAYLFGTSAKYIDSLRKNYFCANEKYPLENLQILTSTGSPLVAENFDYVYENIKKDLCLSSIAGGTDIISCFVLGNPIGKVYRGEIQTRGLGMKVCVFNDDGKSVVEEKGELVCTLPFPSRPIYFWNDEAGKKYHASYFNRYENVWLHGDWMEITKNNGAIIYGRSDSTLNPGGVRIGTAEIYRQVEQLDEIMESIVVEQQWKQDNRIILFVVLREGFHLDSTLIEKIKNKLKIGCSPRHVPAKVIAVPEIPRTKSGKIMEIAVKYAINNLDIKNKDAMANPEALSYFQNISQLQTD